MGQTVRFLSVAFLLVACSSSSSSSPPVTSGDAGGGEDAAAPPPDAGDPPADSGPTEEPDAGPPPACAEVATAPVEYDELPGFTATEDFQFDDQGRWVGVDDDGNIVRISHDGERRLFVPNAGELSGMRFLPSGDLVYARVDDGTLYRAAQNGASVPVLSGLVYPNGLEVDLEGFAYVSEQSAGRVRKIDPLTGAFTIVARGLNNPNGLSFSPDYRTLYCGSFGAGVVYAIPFDDDGNPQTPTIFAMTPEAPGAEQPTGPDEESLAAFARASDGDECTMVRDSGDESGVCYTLGTQLYCDPGTTDPWLAPCERLQDGDACTVDLGDGSEPMEGTCTDYAGLLYCEAWFDWGASCEGLHENDSCLFDAGDGSDPVDGHCYDDGMGGLYCWPDLENDPYYVACQGLEVDAECTVDFGGFEYVGRCTQFDGVDGTYCWSDEATTMRGGLDGMGVDECGYVYVTEYSVGMIWRVAPDGALVELLADVPSEWIPNVHWGPGIGGFDRETLYVANRVDGSLYELPVAVGGKRVGYP